MSPETTVKPEYLVINIGAGVQAGASVAVVGVADSMNGAMDLIRKIGNASTGKIVIAEKKSVITRTPVVELKESQESVLVQANPANPVK
jgi:hypothetical protein